MECRDFWVLVESHVSTAALRIQGHPVTIELSPLVTCPTGLAPAPAPGS